MGQAILRTTDDLPEYVSHQSPKVNLFADDILFYHTINNISDYDILQRVISLIEGWSVANLPCFNGTKCKDMYMIIYRKQTPSVPETNLELLGIPLQRVESYKYLGILISCKLTWSAHISSMCLIAKNILELRYRRLNSNTNQDTLKQLYLSLVRPHLDYAYQIWDHHLIKDKIAIKNVQKFA